MRFKRFRAGVAAVMVVGTSLAAGTVSAQEDVSVLAGSCANCHGTDGVSPGSIPPIADYSFETLYEQLLAFKNDEVPGATVMPRHAKGYTDEELEALARYFSEIQPEGDAR